MAKYNQGYSDRKDEYLGMRDGKEAGKKQSYKSRRDESYGMNKEYQSDGKYAMGGVMGHEKTPRSCNAFEAQKRDYGRVEKKPMNYRGNPDEAWEYKY